MLRVSDISKIYTSNNTIIPVLRNISFTIEKGDFIFLTGSSGAGKTTLLKLLILQEYPSKGSIVFEDVNIEKLPKKLIPLYRRTLGVVFQDYKLLENKTVFENIAFVLEILNREPKEIKDTVYRLLEIVKLTDRANLFPKQLSGGEKRRVVIARAIANNPKLLIADEPTGDLDPENSDRIVEILKAINSAGTSVIMTTHNIEFLDRYPQYKRWHLDKGEIFEGKEAKRDTSFKEKLQATFSPELFEKLTYIAPKKKEDLLSVTPSFLKHYLQLTDTELRELIQKAKSL